MKSLQQAASEFFDECVKNGIAPDLVSFKSVRIDDVSRTSYLFVEARVDGAIVNQEDNDDDEVISETVNNGIVTQVFKSGKWRSFPMPTK